MPPAREVVSTGTVSVTKSALRRIGAGRDVDPLPAHGQTLIARGRRTRSRSEVTWQPSRRSVT